MLTIEKYAAIDIGSNAVRLLISSVIQQEGAGVRFKKTSLVRVPIRLGGDVFVNQYISKINMDRMLDTMAAYSLLMKSHNVVHYKACATSAMRNATNGPALVDLIAEKTGIKVAVIDGEDEAAIIASTDFEDLINTEGTYLYVDVGGGSTEFTLYHNGQMIASRSFQLGTVRLLNGLVSDTLWQVVGDWVSGQCAPYTHIALIGSGGNINNIFKNSGKPAAEPLSFRYLNSYYQLLNSLTYEQRIWQLKLNADRADVIVHAARIYLAAMKWSRSRKIYVPKIGLADGMIKSLYHEHKGKCI